MSRDEPDPDDADGREPADGSDDEPEHPSYTWEGGESGWRDEHEPGRRSADEDPRPDRDPRRRGDDGRRGDRRPTDGRATPPRDGRASDPTPSSPGGRRGSGGSVRTREGVGWNFDSPHPDHGARRDEHERRRRRNPPGGERGLREDDGVKPIDFGRKGAFDFAFSYPVQRGWGALLKAGAVVLFSPLLVFLPLVFLFGYVFRLTRHAAQGRDQPAFEDYGDMLTDGIGYVVVFTFASAVWLGGVVAGAALHDAVAVVFALAGFYLFPAALTVYPVTGSVTKTFSSSLTFDLAFSTHYLKYYALYVVLLVVLRIVASFSMLLFIIGIAWGWAFTYLANGAYWGFVYYKGASEGALPAAADVDQRDGY